MMANGVFTVFARYVTHIHIMQPGIRTDLRSDLRDGATKWNSYRGVWEIEYTPPAGWTGELPDAQADNLIALGLAEAL